MFNFLGAINNSPNSQICCRTTSVTKGFIYIAASILGTPLPFHMHLWTVVAAWRDLVDLPRAETGNLRDWIQDEMSPGSEEREEKLQRSYTSDKRVVTGLLVLDQQMWAETIVMISLTIELKKTLWDSTTEQQTVASKMCPNSQVQPCCQSNSVFRPTGSVCVCVCEEALWSITLQCGGKKNKTSFWYQWLKFLLSKSEWQWKV